MGTTEKYFKINEILTSLAPIPAAELVKIRQIFQPLTIAKEGNFVSAGQIPQLIGFILTGLLRSYFTTTDGNEYTMSFFSEGEFVTSYSAALLGSESRIFIEALEDTTMLAANFRDFYRLLDTHECWQIVGRKLAEFSFLKKEQREVALLADDAQTRYLDFLRQKPELEKRIKQHYIASYLGISPVSLSRLRAKLNFSNQSNS